MLSDFILHSRRNQRWNESGLDSRQKCFDRAHFDSYPYAVEYIYNSRGFRDTEWPTAIEELKNAIWCFGDSFTVGLGSPLEHTWVNILQQQTGFRCINVSMDGASNEWIARKINRIVEEINPQRIVVQWSYLHRTESNNAGLTDEARRKEFLDDVSTKFQLTNFKQIRSTLRLSTTEILESFIPGSIQPSYQSASAFKTKINELRGSDWPDLTTMSLSEFNAIDKKILNEIKSFKIYDELVEYITCNSLFSDLENLEIKQLDFARDHHHYDYLTAGKFVDSIIERFNLSSSATATLPKASSV